MKKLIALFATCFVLCTASFSVFASTSNISYFSLGKEHCKIETSTNDYFDGTLGAEVCRGNTSLGANVEHFTGKAIGKTCDVTKWNLTATYGFHVIDVSTVNNGSLQTYGYDY